jgi:hypothetical protein
MPTLQQTVSEKFLVKLAESKEVDAAKIDELRRLLLTEGKKSKVDEFVRVFSLPAGAVWSKLEANLLPVNKALKGDHIPNQGTKEYRTGGINGA